jgi:competence ComEA-like helix-hairpin-helix protein
MSDKSWDKDWLVFTRKSRRGIFVLLLVFIIVAVLPRIYRNYFMDNSLEPQIVNLIQEEKEKETLKYENDFKKEHIDKKRENKNSYTYNIPNKPFDPNDYSSEDWKAIGFSEKQVQTILNYIQSGGQFKVKEDVKKLYVIDEDLYADLYDVIDLPDSIAAPIASENDFNYSEENNIPLKDVTANINTASEKELKEVSGIGPFFAKEIVKMRENYGGIYDFKQLLEIYRMDEDKLLKIKGSLVIESSDITKLNINKATRKELVQHKYISWNIANSIVSIRETHGEYKQIEDLLKSILIDQEWLETIRPYLTIE